MKCPEIALTNQAWRWPRLFIVLLLGAVCSGTKPPDALAQMGSPTSQGPRCQTQADGVELWVQSTAGSEKPSFFRRMETFFGNLILPSRKELPFDRSIAFLVGVTEYEHLPRLEFVENDLNDLRDCLLNAGGFDAVYIARGKVGSPELIADYMLNKFPRELDERDRLLFYYSGHGGDLNGVTGYMQFSGAERGNFAHDVMAIRNVEEWSRVIKARHILFVFDACASGLAFASKGDGDDNVRLLRALSGSGSRIVMTAGSGDQETFEVRSISGRGNGVFTRAFLDAIQTGSNGLLSAYNVYSSLLNHVASFAAQVNKKLTPRLWVLDDNEFQGTFVFLNPAAVNKELPRQYMEVLKATPRGSDAISNDRTNWPLVGQGFPGGGTPWWAGRMRYPLSDKDSNAYFIVDAKIVDGMYRMDVTFSLTASINNESYLWMPSPYGSLGNLYLEADLRIHSLVGGILAAGVYFRAADKNSECYELLLSSNGYYLLYLQSPTKNKALQNWTEIPYIQPSTFNRLSVTAVDDIIRIYINGKLCGEVPEGSRRFGRVGIRIHAYGNEKVKGIVDFRNFEVREIPSQ